MLYIVEDDANIRQMESYALKNSGFEVAEFANAAEFWRACETQLPELLLLDIMLPGEDGFALLQKLRNQPQTHDIPVIIVTAKSTEVDAVRGLENGADDYITKPFGIIELVARVKVVLRRIQKPQPARLQAGQIVLEDRKSVV